MIGSGIPWHGVTSGIAAATAAAATDAADEDAEDAAVASHLKQNT
jgi:hypothetical protein